VLEDFILGQNIFGSSQVKLELAAFWLTSGSAAVDDIRAGCGVNLSAHFARR
jgi:hypothetical protein